MGPSLIHTPSGAWVGRVGDIRIALSDAGGAPDRAQVAVAETFGVALASLRARAESYLGLFVDRRKACGGADEAWWLDEIAFHDRTGSEPVCYALHFTLHGDDGGQWTVDMRAGPHGHRPYRFARRQG